MLGEQEKKQLSEDAPAMKAVVALDKQMNQKPIQKGNVNKDIGGYQHGNCRR